MPNREIPNSKWDQPGFGIWNFKKNFITWVKKQIQLVTG
jgi:hypothetical protein